MTVKTITFSTITNYYGEYDDDKETRDEAIRRIISDSDRWDGEELIADSILEE